MLSENKDLLDYISNHSSPEDDVLYKLTRATHLHVMQPRMLSGHIQGLFLQMVSSMIKPSLILEIGTFTGYSAICLARGLAPNGILHTIEINDELENIATKYISMSNVANKITQHIGNALDIIPQIEGPFDLVFIDGDKREYPEYYHAIIDRVAIGGYILADNVLWSGKVIEDLHPNDKYTKGVLDFNRLVTEDPRIENVLLPIRDGLMIMRKTM